MNRRTVLLGVTLSLGCDEPDPRGPTGVAEVLVSATDWVPVDPIEDPFADRPATFACPEPTRTVEYLNGEPALEVVTGACEYLAVGQPSLVDIELQSRVRCLFSADGREPTSLIIVPRIDSCRVG